MLNPSVLGRKHSPHQGLWLSGISNVCPPLGVSQGPEHHRLLLCLQLLILCASCRMALYVSLGQEVRRPETSYHVTKCTQAKSEPTEAPDGFISTNHHGSSGGGVCVCVYTHVCGCICGYVHAYMRVHVCVYVWVSRHVHVFACIHVHVCMCAGSCEIKGRAAESWCGVVRY